MRPPQVCALFQPAVRDLNARLFSGEARNRLANCLTRSLARLSTCCYALGDPVSDLDKNIEGAALTKAHAEGNTRRPDDSPSESELKLVPKAWHPELNTKGHKVPIDKPHQASDPISWASGDQVALVTPGGTLPEQLNGIPFAPWADIPQTEGEWENVDGQAELYEPPFHCPGHLGAAAGVIIKEQDGRVWIAAPTNGFGGSYVFPKGRTDGMSLQATAIKDGL